MMQLSTWFLRFGTTSVYKRSEDYLEFDCSVFILFSFVLIGRNEKCACGKESRTWVDGHGSKSLGQVVVSSATSSTYASPVRLVGTRIWIEIGTLLLLHQGSCSFRYVVHSGGNHAGDRWSGQSISKVVMVPWLLICLLLC
jgi:hypothetical protein